MNVATTDTYCWVDEFSFTAEKSGVYTFTVPAGLGVHNKATMMSNPWAPPMVDFYANENGATFTLTMKAGETVTLVFGALTKGNWTLTWTAEVSEDAEQNATSGTLNVTTTDTYCWIDEFEFVATVAGKYTFTVPAGLGVHNKATMMSNPWAAPMVDYYDNENGATFTMELAAGEKVTFVVGALKKADWAITWTVEGGSEGGESGNNNAVVGMNTVVITDPMNGADLIFVVDKAGTFEFKSNDLMVIVLDANGMQVGRGMATLEPGTYTLKCIAMGATGTFTFELIAEYAPLNGDAVLGENTVIIENGSEGAEMTFVVEAAGNYKFASGSVMIKVLNENGMMLFTGQGYLEPGTYTLMCWAMGMTGTFQYTITTDAFDAPSVEVGENTVVIEDAENGAQFDFTPYEDGTYKFEVVGDGIYLIAIVRDANGDIVGRNEVSLSAGTTYTVSFMVTNDDAEGQAGEYIVNVSKAIEPEGTLIEELPGSMTGNAGDDLFFSYVATEDCIVDLVIVAGNPLITLPNGESYEDIENGKRIALKAGDVLVINPWNSAEAFEITISIYDPETELGGAKNPDTLENTSNGTQNVTIPTTDGYYYNWTATKEGKVTFTLNELETMEGKEILVNGIALTLDAKTLTIDVNAGDVISIVCKNTGAEATSLLLDVNFQEKVEEQPEETQPTTPPTTAPTQPTTGNSGEVEEPANNTMIIVIVAVVVVAAAVVAVIVLKKKK